MIETKREEPIIIPITEYANFKSIKDNIKFKQLFNNHAQNTKPFYNNSLDKILTAYGVIESQESLFLSAGKLQ